MAFKMDKITSMLIVLSLFVIVREGFQQRDRVAPSDNASLSWHWFGLLIRLLIVGLMFQYTYNWYLTGLIAFILSVVYTVSCNVGSKNKLYYLSNRGIDKLIRKILFFINFDKK